MRFCANLNLLFAEHPFLDRFGAASDAGFTGVEILNPYQALAAEIAAQLKANDLTCALINVPRRNWERGERGLAAIPGREQEFEEDVRRGLEYCSVLDCERLHVMAGVGGEQATYVANLRRAADWAQAVGVTLTLEALNARDMPGYFLRTQAQSAATIEEVGRENVRMQMDLYHMQISEGDLETTLRRYMPLCAHIQIAGVPKRNEPSTGEVNYTHLFALLREVRYKGWIGCEYHPAAGTVEGLAWMRKAMEECER
jgi:2-dehydrotetronate isomerase